MNLISMQQLVQHVQYNVRLSVNDVSQKHVMMFEQILGQAEQALHTIKHYIECSNLSKTCPRNFTLTKIGRLP